MTVQADVTPPGPDIVDGHVHVAGTSLIDARGYRVAADVDSLLGAMRGLGVAQAVLVQPSGNRLDHTYLLDCLIRHPAVFVGVALVSPDRPDLLEELLAGERSKGITGIRMVPLMAPDIDWFSPDHDEIAELAAASRLAVSLLLHPSQLGAATEWVARHPDVVTVIDHLARPDLCEDLAGHVDALRALAAFPRVHVRVSALQQLTDKPGLRDAIRAVAEAVLTEYGPHRLIWGSDFPYVRARGYSASLNALDAVLPGLTDETRDKILAANARRVFRLADTTQERTHEQGSRPGRDGRTSHDT